MIFLSFSWLTSSTSSTQVYALIVIVRDSSCALAAKIFEYNFEVEYPSSTSASSSGEITSHTQPDLKTYLKEYERVRWLPTTSLTVKAAILGERPTIFSWIGHVHHSAPHALFSNLLLVGIIQDIWKLDLGYWVTLGEYVRCIMSPCVYLQACNYRHPPTSRYSFQRCLLLRHGTWILLMNKWDCYSFVMPCS